MRLYTRTDLSEEHVAIKGRYGWGADSQARERDGGVQGERRARVPGRFGNGGNEGVAIADCNGSGRAWDL